MPKGSIPQILRSRPPLPPPPPASASYSFFSSGIKSHVLFLGQWLPNLPKNMGFAGFSWDTSNTLIANLWHVCQSWHATTFWLTRQHSSMPDNKLQKHALSSSDLGRLQQKGVLLCSFQKLQRPWKRILQSHFKNKGLVWLGTALAVLHEPVIRNRILLVHSSSWRMEQGGTDRELFLFCCGVGMCDTSAEPSFIILFYFNSIKKQEKKFTNTTLLLTNLFL